jgi:DNA ligase D-like protein (predicted ligase)
METREHAQKRVPPGWVRPMLATLASEAFSDDDWIFESKLDGVRCLVFRNKSRIQLLSRNRQPLNKTYPELVEPLAAQRIPSFVVDGEVVAFKDGVTSFSQLQRRMQVRDPDEARRRAVKVFYYLFDLLYLNGYDLRKVPLLQRKDLLQRNFQFRDPLRYSTHRQRDGEAFFQKACRQGLEGVMAKRAASVYVSGRSRDWLKFKCSAEQEFVVVGYTDPKGQRESFGALLVGYYKGDRLVYAGKVGTGFDSGTLRQLGRELSRLHVEQPPVAGVVKGRGVHWVKPKLLAQVAFAEWTHDGKLRHPRFMGLRRDKTPRHVVRERPK